jgi:two-component system, NtrC family, sensor histidine kinase PilS
MSAVPPNEPADSDEERPHGTLQYVAAARVLIAAGLLLSVFAFDGQTFAQLQDGFLLAVGGYFVGSAVLALLALYARRRPLAQALGQIAFDLVLISMLVVTSGGLRSGLVLLFLLPLSLGSLTLSTTATFSVCSLVVIAVLLDTLVRSLLGQRAEASLFQAGLYGAVLFGITGLLRLLAQRLSVQEQLARSRGLTLRNQLEINRMVIAQLEQGVVVVNAAGRVRANNRASRLLFRLVPDAQLTGRHLAELEYLAPLTRAFDLWRQRSEQPGAARTSFFDLPEMRLRVRFARPASGPALAR